MNHLDLIARAVELVTGDRQREYGDILANMHEIARRANDLTGGNITAREVAAVHVATKATRLRNSPQHLDSYVDYLAYFAAFGALSLEPDASRQS